MRKSTKGERGRVKKRDEIIEGNKDLIELGERTLEERESGKKRKS